MERFALQKLIEWKQRRTKKPLIIQGARQVGKTYLMKEFGRTQYDEVVYFNFEKQESLKALFEGDLLPHRLIKDLERYSEKKIVPENTLLIFDEIQAAPRALTSLKYFNEDAPEYDIVCAGSLLGILLHEDFSYPVGNVDTLDLYPMSFKEYLHTIDNKTAYDIVNEGDFESAARFKGILVDALKDYYFVGGMPEAVSDFIQNRDYNNVRSIQKQILSDYANDITKHVPGAHSVRAQMIFDNVPTQLSKENRKFVYGQVRSGARARDYEEAMLWLKKCGLIYLVNRASKIELPIKSFIDLKAFKLFIVDVGLLSAMAGLSQRVLAEGDALFGQFKGALTEQFVFQELVPEYADQIYYWSNSENGGSAEVDFIIDTGDDIVPIEVKAEQNVRGKSLLVYREKFKPKLAIRTSMMDYEKSEGFVNIPLYMISAILT